MEAGDSPARQRYELQIGNEHYLAWEEATEREVTIDGLNLAELKVGRSVSIRIPEGSEEEPLTAPGGEEVGALAPAIAIPLLLWLAGRVASSE